MFLHLGRSLFLVKPQAFNSNGSDRVIFCVQTVMESIVVNLQTFTINVSDGVHDEACFYRHALVARVQ